LLTKFDKKITDNVKSGGTDSR